MQSISATAQLIYIWITMSGHANQVITCSHITGHLHAQIPIICIQVTVMCLQHLAYLKRNYRKEKVYIISYGLGVF